MESRAKTVAQSTSLVLRMKLDVNVYQILPQASNGGYRLEFRSVCLDCSL